MGFDARKRLSCSVYAAPWGVYDGSGATLHVVPQFGRQHDINDGCWCHPERDKDDTDICMHNVEH